MLMPNQSIKFLGFLINSTSMNIRPTPDKIDKVIALASSILSNKTCTVYSPASFIGVIVSNFLPVKYGPLHYRALESDKCESLKINKGNYKGKAII